MQINDHAITAGGSRPSYWILPAACGLLLAAGGCRPQGGPPPPMTPEVAVAVMQPEPVAMTTELPGRTAAFMVSEIRPQVNGIIQKRLFDEGSEVKAGQVLYQIDPDPFQAALDNANASLARARAGLAAIKVRVERYEGLLADHAISRQDYDDAAAAMQQAEAEIKFNEAAVEAARINLEYTRVTAPISGRIGKSSVTDGALVVAYQPLALATIQQLDPIYVDAPQSTAELMRLRRRLADGRLNHGGANHNKVKLLLDDGTPYAREGELQFQDITVDPTTGSVTLRAVFPNPDGVLLPGMFVRMVVNTGVKEAAILVPQQSISRNPRGEPYTLIVDTENKAQPRPLQLDRAIGDKWLVTAGLAAGDRVIVEGMQRVRPGVAVKVALPENGAAPASDQTGAPAAEQSH